MKRTVLNGLLLLISAYLAACASVEPIMNRPMVGSSEKIQPRSLSSVDETLLILTFSGGGTRAAALSYGVLKALENTPMTMGKSLLDEVDVISSVSGGSFTAAYYGLFGKRIFQDYERVFLRRSVQSELLNAWLLSPQNWGKLGSNHFNRTDLAAEYYGEHIFANKTFADMREDSPLIIINTTDISTGTLFSFTPENMQWICSEWTSYPVSRAVAASSAIPGIFSPITLENYGGCSVNKAWQTEAGISQLQDKARYPYLHLVDGGISDNLGIRGVLRGIRLRDDDLSQLLREHGLRNIKHVAFIVVDAADDIPPHIAQTPDEPTPAATLGAVSTIQLKRYNQETLNRLQTQIAHWQQQGAACTEANCQPIDFHVMKLDFGQLPKILADKVSLYETSLELNDKQVDTLVYGGQFMLQNNPDFLRFLR